MRVELAFLADYAVANPDGKFYVIGGGIQRVESHEYPTTIPLVSLVVRIRYEPEESAKQFPVRLEAFDPAGSRLMEIRAELWSRPNPDGPDLPTFGHLVLSLQGMELRTPGTYQLRLTHLEEVLCALDLRAMQGDVPSTDWVSAEPAEATGANSTQAGTSTAEL